MHTTENSTKRIVGSHAHQVTYLEQTTIMMEGKRVRTITWNPALLRRLEAKGESREQYVARIAERHLLTLQVGQVVRMKMERHCFGRGKLQIGEVVTIKQIEASSYVVKGKEGEGRVWPSNIEVIDREWFDNIPDEVYELATRRSEKLYNVGLTGLWDQGDHDDVAELVEEATADLVGNHDTDEVSA